MRHIRTSFIATIKMVTENIPLYNLTFNLEMLLCSTKANKYRDQDGLKQTRDLVVTNQAVYNLSMDAWTNILNRRIPISKIREVSVSVSKTTDEFEFVIHVPNEYDYRFSTSSPMRRAAVISAIGYAVMNDITKEGKALRMQGSKLRKEAKREPEKLTVFFHKERQLRHI